MKLIAIHEIVRKPKAVQPGEEFEATDKEAAELIGLGAARAKAAEEPAAEEPAAEEPAAEEPAAEEPAAEEPAAEEPAKRGRKKKDLEADDSVI